MTPRLLTVGILVAASLPVAAADLTIGSPAPRPEIETWFHDREPITSFEAGKVYVIEFWATWCGPCIASMPHLKEIQERHAADGLTVISVSDEDPAKIEAFLDREHGETTFRELTGHYHLATDPDGSMRQGYMRAADQNGIPTAFIVGKDGLIEWIGHPMRIDEPVARVLAGDWDRAAYARRMKLEQEFRRTMMAITMKARQNQFGEARELLGEALAATEDPEFRTILERARGQIERQAEMHAEKLASQGMDLGQQERTVAALIEMAFALGSGGNAEAQRILDGQIDEVRTPSIRVLLEQARKRLETSGDPP